jgi:cytochrome P450
MDGASNLLDNAFKSGLLERDPTSVYQQIRATGERSFRSVVWGAPVLHRYSDVAGALRDPVRFSNYGRVVNHLKINFPAAAKHELRPLVDHYTNGLINSDPPEHTRLRRLIQSAFLPRTLERLRERVDAVCVELLDNAGQRGTIDWVQDFAFQLPVTMIAELLGIPQDMREQFKDWSVRTTEFMATPNPSLEVMLRSQTALLELRAYFSSVCAERLQQKGEDLISLLVHAEVDGDRLTEDEVLGTCVTLLIGGHETTTSLLTSAVWLIGENPQVRQLLKQNPDKIPSAVEEILRYSPPFHRILRVATCDMDYAGISIKAGETVVLLLGAANRDPETFADPDVLNVERSPNRHVSFGYGIHHCLGAGLARMEAPAALTHLMRRFPDFKAVTQTPDWHDGMVRSIRKWEVQVA